MRYEGEVLIEPAISFRVNITQRFTMSFVLSINVIDENLTRLKLTCVIEKGSVKENFVIN